MNLEPKKLWLEALRGNNYIQGSGSLAVGDKFCCLGVLCDIYYKETGLGQWNIGWFSVGAYRSGMYLPEPVREWAGLLTTDPLTQVKDKSIHGVQQTLSQLNDQPLSFNEIADIIEEQL